MPLVSVIVPCYNQASFLSDALDSVLAQTYTDWECIIVNDGSTDNTEEVAKTYIDKDSRFAYVHKNNGGLPSARNFGISKSTGDFILPLDADDLIGSSYLEKAISRFKSFPETKLVYCKAAKFGHVSGAWSLGEYSYDAFIWKNMIFCSCIFRRADYDKTTGYNENMRFGYEDWDFLLSLLKPDDNVYCIEDTLFFYRIRKGTMTKSMTPHMEFTLKKIVSNHPDIYENYLTDIIWLKRLVEYYRDGLPYRIGAKILRPYRFIKSFFTGRKYIDK